jgi:hypothetical protein
MPKNARKHMESAGWKLAREDQPGIYVRRQDVIKNDPIDWSSAPTVLIRELRSRMSVKTRTKCVSKTVKTKR